MDLVDGMRNELIDEIDHSNWLDDDTKDLSKLKLRALKWQIGIPNFFAKRENIEMFYEGVSMHQHFFG